MRVLFRARECGWHRILLAERQAERSSCLDRTSLPLNFICNQPQRFRSGLAEQTLAAAGYIEILDYNNLTISLELKCDPAHFLEQRRAHQSSSGAQSIQGASQ